MIFASGLKAGFCVVSAALRTLRHDKGVGKPAKFLKRFRSRPQCFRMWSFFGI